MQFLHEVSYALELIKEESQLKDGKRQRSATLIKLLKEFGCEKGSDTSMLRNFIKQHVDDFLQLDADGLRVKLDILKSLLEVSQPNQKALSVVLCQYGKLFKESNATEESKLIVKDVLKVAKVREKRKISLEQKMKKLTKMQKCLIELSQELNNISKNINGET